MYCLSCYNVGISVRNTTVQMRIIQYVCVSKGFDCDTVKVDYDNEWIYIFEFSLLRRCGIWWIFFNSEQM